MIIPQEFTPEQEEHISGIKPILRDKILLMQYEKWYDHSFIDASKDFDNVFLSGGAIASLLQGEEINDLDLYFTDLVTQNKFVDMLKSSYNMEYIKDVDEKYSEVFGVNGKMITSHAITMKSKHSFITMCYGSPEEVKKTFDFKHCMPHYSIAENKLYISPLQYWCIVNKMLYINTTPKAWRIQKFIDRGYEVYVP